MKKVLPPLLFFAAAIGLSAQIEVISNGYVGIGTSSPGRKLEISAASSVYQKITSTSSNDAAVQFSSAGTDAYIGRLPGAGGGSGTLDFYNGGLRMVAASSG